MLNTVKRSDSSYFLPEPHQLWYMLYYMVLYPGCKYSLVMGTDRVSHLSQVAPNVRVSNPIGQSQSRVNISTGCRETLNGRQRVSNQESVTPRKPGGGWRKPEENRKSATKSQSPGRRTQEPQENRTSTTKNRSPQQRVSHPWKLSNYLSNLI